MNKYLFFLCLAETLFSGFANLVRAVDAPSPHLLLRELVERSDLIVMATPQTVCEMCLDSGPYPNGVTLTPEYREFFPRLKIDRVLKGSFANSNMLTISFVAMAVRSKDPPQPVSGQVVFRVDSPMKEVALPGSPLKGVSYIFFLEDLKIRQPDSHSYYGKEELVYRNFDYWFGMIPTSDALVFEIGELLKVRER